MTGFLQVNTNGKVPKVFFIGSGKFAIAPLLELSKSAKLDFIGGATGIPRPGKRGKILIPTPVGAAARDAGINLLEVADINAPDFLDYLRRLEPDFILLVSFGQILKADILSLPKFGCVNIHPSPLPRYRGASPVVQTVLNRDKSTAICFTEMEKTLDSGKIYYSIPVDLTCREYAGALEENLSGIAAGKIADVLCGIADGSLQGVPQSGEISYCGKISKSDAIIDWSKDAAELDAMIRAYNPWPGACAVDITSNTPCRVSISQVEIRSDLFAPPGEMVEGTPKKMLCIGCGSGGALEILQLTPQGGKPMTGADYRNGKRQEKIRFSPAKDIADLNNNL